MHEAPQPHSITWFVFGLLLVAAFAWTRPLTLTDFENRRLARNVTAQLFFTLLYVALYVTLFAAYQGGGRIISGLADGAGWLGQVARRLKQDAGQPTSFAPLLALATIGWFQSLAVLREVERTALVYVYSARYMFTDVAELAAHLERCTFEPTEAERARNRQVLERLNVFLTDKDTAPIDLRVVGDWRKVETLVRHLQAWSAETKQVLTEDETRELERVVTAHDRKTMLAMNIVRMLDHLASGQAAPERIGEVSDLLAKARSGNAVGLDAVEARIDRVLAEATPAKAARPLYLSNLQLMTFLGQIQSYFEEEYRILLKQAAELTAKTVIHSGDRAPERLRAIKLAGFDGLGRILPIGANRILWMFFAVLIASFLLFVMRQWLSAAGPGAVRADTQRMMMMAGFIAFTTACAAIVGAIVGSTRRLAQCPKAPWRAYLTAGLVAVTVFFVVHATRLATTGGIERPPAAALTALSTAAAPLTVPVASPNPARMSPWNRPPSVVQSAPWAVIPFVVTIAICLLARLPAWPLIGRTRPSTEGGTEESRTRRGLRIFAERTADGLALGLAMAAALAVVLRIVFPLAEKLVPGSGIRLSPRLAETMSATFLPLPLLLVQLATGIFIGALIIRDVRRAGHSRVVTSPVPQPPKLALPRAAGRLPIPMPGPT